MPIADQFGNTTDMSHANTAFIGLNVAIAASPNNTTIPSASQIVDNSKNVWTVVGGVVNVNGAAAGFTQNVILLLWWNGTIYQENNATNWWSWNGTGWTALTGAGAAGDPRTVVVNTASFNLTVPATSGAVVGTATVSQGSPITAWSITAGNANNWFAINSSTGVITLTSAGASGLTTTQTISLTVQGTNGVNTAAAINTVNASTSSGTGIVTPGFYVAPNGNDTWSGTLAAPNGANTDGPFLTLGKAQSAMRGAGALKRTWVRTGTYATGAFSFTSSDNSTTWINYPNESPIWDAGGGANTVHLSSCATIAFYGLTFNNLGGSSFANSGFNVSGCNHIIVRWCNFNNAVHSCISGQTNTFLTIDSNTFTGTQTPAPEGQAECAVVLWTGSHDNTITHNLAQNCQGGLINFNNGPSDTPQSNNVIDRNIARNCCIGSFDDACYYIYDPGHAATGCKITNNIVDLCSGTSSFRSNQIKGIYLDDGASNVQVTGNLVRYCGEYALQYHGGNNNTISNNVFDLSANTNPSGSTSNLLSLYQSSTQINIGMTGNTFTNNVVYMANGGPGSLWSMQQGGQAVPTVNNNMYFSATGATITTGTTETNRVNSNPQFSNPNVAAGTAVAANYAMPSGQMALIGFTALVTDQGPLTYAAPM